MCEVKTAVITTTLITIAACKAAQAVDCGAEALMVPGTEAATCPVILEPQSEGWQCKRLRLEHSVQAQDQGECNNEMATIPQVRVCCCI